MSTLRLVPVIGDDLVVDLDSAVVGREPTCDVVVEHGSVSRRHAVLERRGGSWFVVDQGSANGTFLDSVKVGEGALRHGQELRFGAAAFRVDLPEASDEAGATLLTSVPEATVLTPAAQVSRPAAPPARSVAPPPLPGARA
ncbi:MAG TPA: FHA domain-containing protein, partial [Vicinamibacteria bacterium]|nr:FHA domain-containing protein [Vicinamibacteria bacterium]